MTKTLVFERAGMKLNDMNDVGTGRIRTAFHIEDGKALYLELIAMRRMSGSHVCSWALWDRTGFIDSCYEMEGDEIKSDYIEPDNVDVHSHFEWTIEKILELVNSIGGDFESIRIADPEEYRVFKDSSGNHCNFGDL